MSGGSGADVCFEYPKDYSEPTASRTTGNAEKTPSFDTDLYRPVRRAHCQYSRQYWSCKGGRFTRQNPYTRLDRSAVHGCQATKFPVVGGGESKTNFPTRLVIVVDNRVRRVHSVVYGSDGSWILFLGGGALNGGKFCERTFI